MKKTTSKLLSLFLSFALIFSYFTNIGAITGRNDWEVYAADAANAQYSLAGAVYYVYTDAGCTVRAKNASGADAVLTTAADGTTNEIELDAGTYYVKEVVAPKGYILDGTVYTAVVTPDNTTWVNGTGGTRDIPQSAPLSIQKVDALTGKTAISNAQYDITYTDGGSVTRTWKVKTGSDGIANLDDAHFISGDTRYKNSSGSYVVPLGTVTVKEVAAPNGYVKSNEVFTINIGWDGASATSETTRNVTASSSAGGTVDTNPIKVYAKDSLQSAPFAIQKVDSLSGRSAASAGASFKDARFELKYVGDQFSRTWIIKTDENGYANLDDTHFVSGDARYKNAAGEYAIPANGTVTVREIQSPKGYAATAETFTVKVNGDGTGNDTTTNVTITASGSSTFTVNPAKANVKEMPQSAPLRIQKYDAETGKTTPSRGDRTFKDIEFEVKWTDGTTTKTWIIKTDENGLATLDDDHFVSGDERYKNSKGEYAIRLGTVTVKERTAPKDYAKSNEVFTIKIEGDTSGTETTSAISGSGSNGGTISLNPATVKFNNQVIRGDIEIIKTMAGTGMFAPGIPFVIRSVETGEMHVFVTNANGHATTEARPTANNPNLNVHTYKTNSNDYVIDSNGNPILVDGEHVDTSRLDAAAGVWFSKGIDGSSTTSINNNLGALPKGTYYVSELPVPANDGMNLYKNLKFIVENDGLVVDGGTRQNFPYRIRTEASDSYSNSTVGTITNSVSIKDRVTYSSLDTNKTYKLKTEVHWAKASGTGYVDGGIVSDANGRELKSEKTFRPMIMNDYITTTVGPFNSTKLTAGGQELKGESLVVFEYLYLVDNGEELLLISEEDPENEDQTIVYPDVSTLLTDNSTGIRMGLARANMALTDAVTYKNFVPNYTYTFRATLYDKDTGQVLKDKQGNDVIIREDHRITQKNGTVNLSYNFDSSHLENKTIVSKVEIYGGGMPTIVHDDLNDENQTLHIPKIRTKATDVDTQDEVGKVVGTFKDVVTYQNLLPGYSYTMSATLMDKATGSSIGTTGSQAFEVTASTTDPTRADGTVTVTMPLNMTKANLEGKTLVAFESCLVKAKPGNTPPARDTVVAEHKDLEDKDQTIHYPKIRTTGVDSKTADHVGTVGNSEQIKDTVTYWNLVPGKSYTIRGKIVDKATGETIATADDLTFTAAAADANTGSKTLTFNVNSSALAGVTVVAYEKLIHNNVEVTQHEEISDETQSVHYPWLNTVAIDEKTGDHVSSIFGRLINLIRRETGEGIPVDSVETIIDTVEYKNLIPSETYTVSGVLMSKETGQPVTRNGQNVTATATLASGAHAADGSVQLKFLVDSSEYTNTTFVCYEKLLHKNPVTGADIEVNRHENLNDENQSVHAVALSTTAIDQHAEDHVGDTTKATVIDDAVEMKNLVGGMSYTLKGTLYNKETGEKLLIDGQPVTAEKTFTASGGTATNKRVDQTEHLTFNVDGTKLENITVVVFEDLYHNDVRISTHSDINDEAQSVHFPKVETLAVDSKTEDHVGTVASSEKVIDTVSLKTLIPGQKYIVSGKLVKQGTGQPLLKADGSEITASKTFTADARDMTVTIEFSGIDTTIYRGVTAVAFEKLYHPKKNTGDNVEVARHEDANDEAQSVHYPELKTHAIDQETGGHVGSISKTAKVKDEVTLENLIVGQKYTIKGVLMFKDDVKDLEGNVIYQKGTKVQSGGADVTAEKSFTAEAKNEKRVLEFSLDSSVLESATVVAFEKLYHPNVNTGDLVEVVQHEDLDDEEQSVHYPRIGTIASDGLTEDHVGATEQNTIKDTVKFENLIVGQKYRLKGVLMNKKTGEPLLIDGEKVESDSGWFTASEVNGTKEVVFDIDASTLDGETIVAYEKLFTPQETDWTDTDKDPIVEVELTNHEDLNDEDQSIHYPKVTTLARDNDTDDHVGTIKNGAQVKDTVKLENLIVGQKYTVKGTLMKFGTTEPFLDGEGNEITAEKSFTATDETMTLELAFREYDSNAARGQTSVCFEYLYHPKGNTGELVEVSTHENPSEEAQSVHYPWIGTVAIDEKTGDHVSSIFGRLINAARRLTKDDAEELETIIDTVEYKNLIPSEAYTIKGTLMSKETGEAVKDKDGNVITSEATLAANSHPADGEIQLKFLVDSSEYTNTTFVCYEKLFHQNPVTKANIEVDRHENIDDEDQSVHAVKIATTAIDEHTGDHVGDTTKETVIDDAVEMKNLVYGMEYKLVGTLYNKATGEKLLDASGNPYVSEKTFTPSGGTATNKRVDQTEHLTFNVDGTKLEDVTVVVYEDLYHNGIRISTHSDINDEAQSVHFPKVETLAVDSKTDDHVGTVSEKEAVVDTVSLKNLIPGMKYTVSGKLMKHGTTEPLLDKDGSEITASKTFTADARDMTVVIEFTGIDTSIYRGQTAVAFEKLYHPKNNTGDDVEVAKHEDPNDEVQSVHYPKIWTTAVDRNTGDHVGSVFGSLINGARRLLGIDVSSDQLAGIIDTVEYRNLIPDEEYTVIGTLMSKETGKAIKDANGNIITESAVLKAGHPSDGSIKIHFNVDSSLLTNDTIVCYEKLMHKNPITKKDIEVDRHEDLSDEDQSVHEVKIRTTATDAYVALEGHESKHHGDATGRTVIRDAVIMENLVKGMSYTLKGTLHYKDSGEAVLNNEGKPYETTVTFKAEGDGDSVRVNQTVDVFFSVDGKALEGRTVVAYEELYHNEVMISAHADLSDEEQSVYYPEIRTHAKDNKNGAKETQVNEKTEIIDIVSCKNLLPGKYKLSGILMDKNTGESLKDAEGKEVTAEDIFEVASKEEGKAISRELVFTFSSKTLASHIAVAYETLILLDAEDEAYEVPVAIHKDLSDEDQSVWIIDIKTHLVDVMTGSDEGKAREKAEWRDRVTYLGLIPGKEYTMKGILMDKETGKPFVDAKGNVVTSEAKFRPERKDGYVDLLFTADTRGLAGKSVVAFEELYPEDLPETVIAEHKDIEDPDQTVNIIEIKTNATDDSTTVHEGSRSSEAKITDRVTYKNLTVGREYILRAVLMNKATGKALVIDDKEVVSEQKFVPEEKDGYVDVTFTLDTTSLAGETLVCFEKLYNAEFDDIVIADHEDIEDPEQSVYIPKIGTFLFDEITGAHISYANGERSLVDSVAYKNLVPGKAHVARGVLMDKATGLSFETAEGEAVTAETVFVPEASSGVVDVVFDIDASELGGATVVAFEELYIIVEKEAALEAPSDSEAPAEAAAPSEGEATTPTTEPAEPTKITEFVLVAEHKDINDPDQIVHLPRIYTEAELTVGKVIDTVHYENLVDGNYLVKGWLVDEDGEKIEDSDGEAFLNIDGKPDGSIDVKLDIPSGFSGKAVAFEELYYEGEDGDLHLVADHKDPDDEKQTVIVPRSPETGDSTRPTLYLAAGILSALLCAILFLRRRQFA